MGGGASTNRMPFSLKLQKSSHPLAELSAYTNVNTTPTVDDVDAFIKVVKESWSYIVSADEATETGRFIKGTDLFSLVFIERFKTLDAGLYAEQTLKQACCKYGVSHAVTVINFVMSLEGRKKTSISRKLRCLGKEHMKRQISHDIMDLFLNAVLLAIGDRLGEKACKDVMASWAGLLLFVSSSVHVSDDMSEDCSFSSRRHGDRNTISSARTISSADANESVLEEDLKERVYLALRQEDMSNPLISVATKYAEGKVFISLCRDDFHVNSASLIPLKPAASSNTEIVDELSLQCLE